ncbi:hypothetical protein GCM10010129_15040 [Streptomyces fumigatiscleroticus]|nr:hypothetical protein GCM10010129_15040 [Streptomyces fumigatiscleroticus]
MAVGEVRGGGPRGGFVPAARAPAQKGPLTAMQIRLTVVDPLAPSSPRSPAAPEQGGAPARGRATRRDVLVTAPAGTALAAVAPALASAVCGADGPAPPVLYAGAQRLDAQRCTLGEPPLVDGAVLYLGAPDEHEPHPEPADVPAQLHVVAGPDAGGVHLLHGGQIHLGRSADADVPLDDPDVSRLHCAVTVSADGHVWVADLDSTNGTTLDGTRVGTRPVRFAPGALLRIGESALRLATPRTPGPPLPTAPDGEGHVRVRVADEVPDGPGGEYGGDAPTSGPGAPAPGAEGTARARGVHGGTGGFAEPTHHAYGAAGWGAADGSPGAQAHGPAEPPRVPDQAGAPRLESHGTDATTAPPRTTSLGGAPRTTPRGSAPRPASGDHDTHAGRSGAGGHGGSPGAPATDGGAARGVRSGGGAGGSGREGTPIGGSLGAPGTDGGPAQGVRPGRKGTPLRGTDAPQGVRRRGGLTAWARRLAGGRGEQGAARPVAPGEETASAAPARTGASQVPETWPDPAALLLTALGPGPRLWERGPGHPEALTVRLGTADRTAPDGSGLLPAVPVTAGLREAGALGLAGPRARLAGLARSVLAQLAALHSPDTLEIVLISADRSRSLEERTAEWSWLGWLPHVRPAHGQDCRLLLAHDPGQARARADELLLRLEDHPPESTAPGSGPGQRAARPPAGGFAGPYSVLVVDGDPGGADVREAVTRLAVEGPAAGIHVVCLAETESASPASPVTETYEAACAVSPVFRACGAVALLSGDVATALRLMRVARPEPDASRAPVPAPRTGTASDRAMPGPGTTGHVPGRPAAGPDATGRTPGRTTAGPDTTGPGPVAHGPVAPGTVATVDAVSAAWAERFARALAPLRPDAAAGERHARVSAPLPQAARLLDELGLARATPASLMARWADAADDTEALGGRAHAVLGAGPRGPVTVDLAAEGPHLLIEGPAGSGRTELLRAVVASLASAERPDRLSIVLMDGRDTVSAGAGSGEGLRVCTDVPHVTTHLTADDPVRMREFAQSLSAELKRRAELLGRSDFAEWHTGRAVSGRMVVQRSAARGAPGAGAGAADLDTPPSATLRLRPAAARQRTQAAPPLPRLVVVVDDLDALVQPPLGSPGRPAAGSVMRALEAVAREGERLGVHLVAATGLGGRTAETEPARRATARATLEAPVPGPDEPAPGRGSLARADGRTVPFQGGRVTGRIPRTATLRPAVTPLQWQRMGDPPARRHVRELGNGPTDLALLASALERAAREVAAPTVPSLL